MNSADVQSFYDDFLESKMLEYRVRGNPRIKKAAERILDFIRPNIRVLEVGCGIGITTERIADEVEEGHVWAFDISERNIWYARETVNRSNVTFFDANITEDEQDIRKQVTEPVDVVTLVDVIEHIPKEAHQKLFEFLRSIMSDRSFVVLTYPSPQYQRYLKESNPEELQIIDQVIEREELLASASPAGFSLCHYSMETVWKRNQYIHCVLQTDASLGAPPSEAASLPERIRNRIQAAWKRRVLHPVRRWWYVDRVFE